MCIQNVLEEEEEFELFDTNAISPGTEFMFELNKKLKFFVEQKTATDPYYQGIKIILSGSDVPGEGEHKIMEYVRWYRAESPDYRPRTRHCIYG